MTSGDGSVVETIVRDGRPGRMRRKAGAVFGVVTWIVASALFFLYVSNFSACSATYGAFAAAGILLLWLWLTNAVRLFGAELNAAIDVRRSPDLPDDYESPPLPAKVPAESSS